MRGKIEVGIIGAGLWGETHAKTYAAHEGVSLVEICDANEDRAKALAEKYGVPRFSRTPERLFSDPKVQIVSIATPDFAHTDHVVNAAESGKNILVEKPLATTVEDCEKILAAVHKAGVLLMVDFHNRWNPVFSKARASIEAGEIGELALLSLRLNNTVFVPTEMLRWASQSSVAWFVGSHCVDLVRFLSGEEVAKVYCVKKSRILKAAGIDTADFYETTLELRSGAVAMVENCWILPKGLANIIDFRGEVIGSRGAFYLNLSHHGALEMCTQEKVSYPDVLVMPEIHGKHAGFAYESIRHFVDCVREGRKPLVSGEDGLQTTKIICAMEKSASEGRPVHL